MVNIPVGLHMSTILEIQCIQSHRSPALVSKRTMTKRHEMHEVDRLTHGLETPDLPYSTATVVELRLTVDDLRLIGDSRDRDLQRLLEEEESNPSGSYVVYEGRPRLTQTALYLMLFQDNIQKWIGDEEPPVMSMRSSIYEDNEDQSLI